MPLSSASVGTCTESFVHDVDARWLMAYAAGLNDLNPRYMDTTAGAVCAHPLFPVCLEWPAILASRSPSEADGPTPEEAARGVHAAHDLTLHRPIRAGDRLQTTATVVAVQQIKPGAAQTLRLDTVDLNSGELVAQTYQLSISRGVEVIGGDRTTEAVPGWPTTPGTAAGDAEAHSISVSAGAAHIYTECARIWNPIHTDRAVALNAGLPGIILHGTATLALAVSRMVNEYAGAQPRRVRRIGGRFV
ncbi:MAG: FAS1-like dehydratase domain-containing protein, partial [Pseudomonadales bacterium]